MTESSPKVSIVIPTYKRSAILKRSLKSVLAQTFQNYEVLVVDDCSGDDSETVVKDFGDRRIRYLKHQTNKGGSAARNTGVREATGEYVAFLDSDDEWLPNKLEKQLALFSNIDESYCAVYTGFICVAADGVAGQKILRIHNGDVFNDLLVCNFMSTLSTLIVKREVLEKISGLDERLKSCQDWDLYLRISKVCKVACCEEYLVRYHIDKKDKARISNNRKSIVQGHELIREKFANDYETLPQAYRVRHANEMANMYTLAADFRKSASYLLEAFLITKNPRYLVLVGISFFRILKRRMTADYGY